MASYTVFAGTLDTPHKKFHRKGRTAYADNERLSEIESYDSVRDAIADMPEQAVNLRTRAELMQKIPAIVKASGWTQTEAARHCCVTQARINDLLRGRVSRFSLDALDNIATALGGGCILNWKPPKLAENRPELINEDITLCKLTKYPCYRLIGCCYVGKAAWADCRSQTCY